MCMCGNVRGCWTIEMSCVKSRESMCHIISVSVSLRCIDLYRYKLALLTLFFAKLRQGNARAQFP